MMKGKEQEATCPSFLWRWATVGEKAVGEKAVGKNNG